MKLKQGILLGTAALSLAPAAIALLSTVTHGAAFIGVGALHVRSSPLMQTSILVVILGLQYQLRGRVGPVILTTWIALCSLLSAAAVFAVIWWVKHSLYAGCIEAGAVVATALAAVLIWPPLQLAVSSYRRRKLGR